jgi:hypothetical protein
VFLLWRDWGLIAVTHSPTPTVLKLILKEQGLRVWIGASSLKMESSCGFVYTFQFDRRWGNLLPSGATQERLCSMELLGRFIVIYTRRHHWILSWAFPHRPSWRNV